jgi:ankyrin repeat protein
MTGEMNEVWVENVVKGNTDEIKKLLEQGGLDTVHIGEYLSFSALIGHNDIVKLFLKYNPDLYSSFYARQTLYAVLSKGSIDIVEDLLEHGVDINGNYDEKGYGGYTILMKAVDLGVIEVVRGILELGAKINITDRYGMTALMYGLKEGTNFYENVIDIVKLLLESGAKTNITDITGKTPLLHALMRQDVDMNDLIKIINLLLEHGAKINITDGAGRTPLIYALLRKNDDINDLIKIINLLLENGADVDTEALNSARENQDYEIVKLLESARAKHKKEEEKNAFNAMIDLYIMYKSGDMSEDMLEQMNNVSGNWIEHCESELIQLGLEYHRLKQSK